MATKTLTELYTEGQNADYGLDDMSLVIKDEDFIMIDQLIYQKYETVINQYIVDIVLNEDDFNRYQYKPDLLSTVVYGTRELYHLILYINSMTSKLEFTRKKIKLIAPDDIEVIQNIIITERRNLDENHNSIRE